VLEYALRQALHTDASFADIKTQQGVLLARSGGTAQFGSFHDTDLAYDIGLYGVTYEWTQRMLDVVIRETNAASMGINVANTK
jgi:hypothetical protein